MVIHIFKLNKFKSLSLLYSFVFLFITYYISLFYVNGDQYHYHLVYGELPTLSFIDAYLYYNNALDSNELIHFLIVWLFGGYIEKDILMSFFNAVLVYYISRVLFKAGGNWLIVFCVLLMSFYSWVLFFSAERLKISVLFFVISFWYFNNGNVKKAVLVAILSLLSHLQIIISYATVLSNKIFNIIVRLITNGVISKFFFLLLIVGICLAIPLSYQVVRKLHVYVNGFEFIDILKWLVYYVLTLSVCVRHGKISCQTLKSVSLIFFPMLVMVFFIGSDRALFFAFFVFLYFAVQKNAGFNLPLCLSLIYFGQKSVFFILSIFEHGDGFIS